MSFNAIVPMIGNLVALKVVSDVALKVASVPNRTARTKRSSPSKRIRAY